jgi:hypothetical protein
MFKVVLLILGLPFFHPESEIKCPKYMPGSNTLVPNGVVFQYSPRQWRDNQMRCYCETVKNSEDLCIQAGYSRVRCIAKTRAWIQENFPIIANPNGNGAGNERDGSANFILNIRRAP